MAIIYLDTSALIKRYIGEIGSAEVSELLRRPDETGTLEITKVEMASAMARLVARGQITAEDGSRIWEDFEEDWPLLDILLTSTATVERGAAVAWTFRLRGYDALHLAAALAWQEALAEPVTLATFDRELWQAAHQAGLQAWPAWLKEADRQERLP